MASKSHPRIGSRAVAGAAPAVTVLESTALISYMQAFDNNLEPLKKLGTGGRVVIPDVVFYELTGILPSSFPKLRLDLKQAHAEDVEYKQRTEAQYPLDPEARREAMERRGVSALDRVIQSYVDASPRSGMGKNSGNYRRQVHGLLQWLAEYEMEHNAEPLIHETEAGKRLCGFLQTEFSLFGGAAGNNTSISENYIPDYSDVLEVLGESYKAEDVYLHVGQLFLMGVIDEEAYKKRLATLEKTHTKKRRFVSVADLADLLTKGLAVSANDITGPYEAPSKVHAPISFLIDNITVLLEMDKIGDRLAEIIADPDTYRENYMQKASLDGVPVSSKPLYGTFTVGNMKDGLSVKELIESNLLPWDDMDEHTRKEMLARLPEKVRDNLKQALGVESLKRCAACSREELCGEDVGHIRVCAKSLISMSYVVANGEPNYPLKELRKGLLESARPMLRHYVLHTMIGQSKLQMNSLVYGGVVQWDALTVPEKMKLAQSLGYKINANRFANGTREAFEQAMGDLGFFEQYVTLRDMHAILEAFPEKDEITQGGDRFSGLRNLCGRIENNQLARHNQRFKQDCRYGVNEGDQPGEYTAPPKLGTPYEKCFSDAMVNGSISPESFLSIVIRSGGMRKSGDGPNNSERYATAHEDVELLYDKANPSASSLLISQDGFTYRLGVEKDFPFMQGVNPNANADGKMKISVARLLEEAQSDLRMKGGNRRLYRVLEAMLFDVAHTNAPKLHDTAQEVLREEYQQKYSVAEASPEQSEMMQMADNQLLQIEKDFSNRHMRKWTQHALPYESVYSGLHVLRRIMRKNLGEISTVETATDLAESEKKSVFIINHDGDLYRQGKEGAGHLHLGEHVYRAHSHMKDYLGSLVPRYGYGDATQESDTLVDRFHTVASGAERPVMMINTTNWLYKIADAVGLSKERVHTKLASAGRYYDEVGAEESAGAKGRSGYSAPADDSSRKIWHAVTQSWAAQMQPEIVHHGR